MSNHASESSLPVLSHADGFAASASDALLLVGRVLLGWLFLTSAWGKFMNMGGYVAYLTNLKVPNPGFFSWIGAPVEFLIGVTLILGFATRYAALVCLLFLIVATALAHRYWEYPAAQVMAQYNNFLKKSCALRRHLGVVLDRCGPLQCRSNAVEERTERRRAEPQVHNSLLASRAPSASASSFAHMIEGWTRR